MAGRFSLGGAAPCLRRQILRKRKEEETAMKWCVVCKSNAGNDKR